MRGATGRIHGFGARLLAAGGGDEGSGNSGQRDRDESKIDPRARELYRGCRAYSFEAKKTEASRNLLGANRKEDASSEHRPFDLFSPGFATSLKACSTWAGTWHRASSRTGHLKMTQENAASLHLNAALSELAESERWYVARTLPQRELHAARQLNNQGFRTFVPRYWKNRRHARRVETISAALFPRYIFVVVDRTRDRWRSINGTLGVDRLLMYGGEPQAVPVGIVENLIAVADGQGNVRFDFRLKEGDAIKVTAGPFADLVGQLEQLDDNGRVRVLLEILGGRVRVVLSRDLLAPAQDVA